MSRKVIAIGAALLAVGVILRVTGLLGTLLSPIQAAVSGVWERLDPNGYRAQYEQAAAELAALRQTTVEQQQAVHDAAFYREFLALKTARPTVTFCEVRLIAVGTDGVTVDRGSVDGLVGGEPVITASGLVGVIGEVGLTWARVVPLTDRSVTVSAVCARTNEALTVQGGEARLSRESEAAQGDYLITSGLGGGFPRGVPIGSLGEVTPTSDGLFRQAAVSVFAACEARMMAVTGW